MVFVRSIGANEDEAAFRVLCKCQRCFVSLLDSGNTRIECLEILVTKSIQIRHFTQLLTALCPSFGLLTLAGNRFAEMRMSKGDISTQVSCSLTPRADNLGLHDRHWGLWRFWQLMALCNALPRWPLRPY